MTGGNIPWLIRSLMLASPAARAKALAPLAHPSRTNYEINPDMCIECGACEGACPVGAPKQD